MERRGFSVCRVLGAVVGICGALAGGEAWAERVLEVDFGTVSGNGNTPLVTSSGAFMGWGAETVYAATNEVRLGSSSKAGVLTSPSLSAEGRVVVSFSARWYGTDKTRVLVGASGDGGKNWVEEAVEPGAATASYSASFAAGGTVQVRWTSEGGKQRFYLSAIAVEAVEAVEPDLQMASEAGFPATPVGGRSVRRLPVANAGARSNLTIRSWSAAGGDTGRGG